MDDMLRPKAVTQRKLSKGKVRSDLVGSKRKSPSPERRRSVRMAVSNGKLPDYDMKHHVVDDYLRPKAAAKRSVSGVKSVSGLQSVSIPPPSTSLKKLASPPAATRQANSYSEVVSKSSPKTQPEDPSRHLAQFSFTLQDDSNVPMPPEWSQLQNPYVKQSLLDWYKLNPIDRQVYLLQKGSPLQGNTLPHNWDTVKQILFDEGYITLDNVNSPEGTEWLKSLYESVRLGVEAFFKAELEPTDKKDWLLAYTEAFNVYLKRRDSKYWEHHEDSIVRLTATKTGDEYRQIAYAEGVPDQSTDGDENSDIIEKLVHRDLDEIANGQNIVCSKRRTSPVSLADAEKTTAKPMEEDEYLRGVEHEDIIVESMRGHDGPSTEHILDDDEFDKLLSPMMQFLMEQPSQPGIARNVSREPNMKRVPAEPPGPGSTIIRNESSHILPEAKGSSQSTSNVLPHLELFGAPRPIKEESNLVNGQQLGKLHPSKVEKKAKKRKSRIGSEAKVKVHEDIPGGTPLVKRLVSMNPASPRTDIPKENFENDNGANLSLEDEMVVSIARRRRGVTSTPRTTRRYTAGSMSGISSYHSIFGELLGSPSSSPVTV